MSYLQDWETRLHPYLEHIKLLAEIPLSRLEHTQLEADLKRYIQQTNLTQATQDFKCRYPAAFAVYLAFKAAFNPERDFWGNVAAAIEAGDKQVYFNSSHHWGDTFLQILQEYKLRTFQEVASKKYITAIRLHGGISAYSLPDFFEYILLPSLQQDDLKDLNDKAALDTLLKKSSVHYSVDDPVQYFFKYGGESAARFFQKCRRMADLALMGQPLPPAGDMGIRPYVVRAFETYLQIPQQPGQRRRLPRLFFEPYLPGFRLLLPAQPVPVKQAQNQYFWEIRLIDKNQEQRCERLPVRVHRHGPDWYSKEAEYLIEQLADVVQVSLVAQTHEGERAYLRRAIRMLPSVEQPLLAFRYSDNALCSITPTLPATELWLFYPADAELHVDGDHGVIEHLLPFAPPWNDWQAHAYNLQHTRDLRLIHEGHDLCPPLPISTLNEPELKGTNPHPQNMPIEEKPLFLGMPQLYLPLRSLEYPRSDLSNWHLQLESRQAAQPQGHWECIATDLPYTIEQDKGLIALDLGTWLNEPAVGTYHLVIEGPGHKRSELPFRVWPALRVQDLAAYYLPTPQGSQTVKFYLHLPPKCQVLPFDKNGLTVQPTARWWAVTVPPLVEHADLWLKFPAVPEVVCVPFRLAVPRLHWALQLEGTMTLKWQDQLVRLPVAHLLQNREPRLWIELPHMEHNELSAVLILNASSAFEPLQSTNSFDIGINCRKIVLNLGQFFDTLRHHVTIPIFDLTLELHDSKSGIPLRLPLIQLTQSLDAHNYRDSAHISSQQQINKTSQSLDIKDCKLIFLPKGCWRLHWYESNPSRYRRLRLWALWQPWAVPVEIPLPDDALHSDVTMNRGWWMANLPEDIALPPAWYLAQFVVSAPDDKEPVPKDPPEDAFCLKLTSAEDRLSQIEDELQKYPQRAFVLHMERVCIFESLEYEAERSKEVQWCLSHWQEANLFHLFALQAWIENREPPTQHALRMHMFCPETLKRLLNGGYPPQFIQAYFECFLTLHTVHPESAYLTLTHAHSPAVLLKAMKKLLKAQDQRAIIYLVDQMNAGRFSDTEAQRLIEPLNEFTIKTLSTLPTTPARGRLWDRLARKRSNSGQIVFRGYWVRSDAGWGRIDEIRHGETGPLCEFFFPKQEAPYLVITLRAKKAPEIMHLDLSKNEWHFPNIEQVYLCTNDGCTHFISTDPGNIIKNHNHTIHGGSSATFRILRPPRRELRHTLEYRATPPKNPFE